MKSPITGELLFNIFFEEGKKNMQKFIICSLFALALCARLSGDETHAIKQRTETYVSAFNKKDAKAMAEHWDQDATFTNRQTGETVKGKTAIAEQLQQNLENIGKGDLKIKIESVKIPENNKAIEEGKATLTTADGDKIETRFEVVFVKRNGEWYISKVNEVERMDPTSNYAHLKDLEWLIGEWIDKDDTSEIASTYQWDENKNFITQNFKVSLLGRKELEGKQIIGWDPINNKVRSWLFDSDGGFAEINWKKDGKNWVLESASTLPHGGQGSQVMIISPIDRNSFTLEITGREIDGKILPNLEPVKIVRKGG
jgi:uncharacterized protein (TIGR02246 family)